MPDNKHYASLEHRVVAAKKFAKRHDLSQNYCFFVDYTIPSGTPRLFVWSFSENKIVAMTYVMHGSGKGSTAEKPVFSNEPGSSCSTLGRFMVTLEHGTRLKRSFRLKGLDIDNQTAYGRGIMLHGSKWVDIFKFKEHIPLNSLACEGCVTVSSVGMSALEKIIKGEDKKILLWSFYQPEES